MFRRIFNSLLELLPARLKEDRLFKSVVKIVKEKIPDEITDNQSRIVLREDLYSSLIVAFPSLKEFVLPSKNDEGIVDFTFINDKEVIAFKINEYQLFMNVKLNLAHYNGVHQKAEIGIFKDRTVLETTFIEEEDYIKNYEYNVFVYDNKGNLIRGADEEAKDRNFANFFWVDLEDAREYRTHFAKYAVFLTNNRLKEQKRLEDLYTIDSLFTSPFSLNDLENYIRKEVGLEAEEVASGATENLADIKRMIATLIGTSEEIVLSSHLYQNLEAYHFKLSRLLYDKGVIIKRLDNQYTLYYVHVENDKIIGMKNELNGADIKKVLDNNVANYDVPGLPKFFGR